MQVARRALKRFTVITRPLNGDQIVYTLVLRSDLWKVGEEQHIPGCWITPESGKISVGQVYDMIALYYNFIRQPWERSYNGL